jgi:hypothetical protein
MLGTGSCGRLFVGRPRSLAGMAGAGSVDLAARFQVMRPVTPLIVLSRPDIAPVKPALR